MIEIDAIKNRLKNYKDLKDDVAEKAKEVKSGKYTQAAKENIETIRTGQVNERYKAGLEKVASFSKVLVTIICFIAVLYMCVGLVKVSGDSMNDTYTDGQLLLQHYPLNIEKGDVITFYQEDEDETLIKRVIATEGDTVYCDGLNVYVNGEALEEEGYAKGSTDAFEELTISEDCIFVMGDNRENSWDSRYFGEVEEKDVYGIIFFANAYEEDE